MPATLAELEATIKRDATYALRRIFTNYCATLDPKSAQKYGAKCDHSTCWHKASPPPLPRQLELCKLVGVDFVSVVNPTPTYGVFKVKTQ